MFKSYYYILVSIFFSLSTVQVSFAQNTSSHTVVAGETLYGIARNYQIHITELLKANPQIQNNAIQPGDIVNIPSAKKINPNPQNHTVPAPQQNVNTSQPFGGGLGAAEPVKNIHTPPVQNNIVKNNQMAMIEHIVQEKQTLYAISKIYNVTIDEIKAWNHLADNNIKVGSVILIRSNKDVNVATSTPAAPAPVTAPIKVDIPAPVVTKEESKPQEVKPSTPVLPTPVKDVVTVAKSNSPQNQLEDAYVQARNAGKSLQSSRGTITWIATENAKMSESYFALHKTAPVGTIVKVTNLVNKRVVFVKVIGKLPETSDNINIVLRISSAAKNALLLNGDKAYVDMDFYQ